MDVRRLSEASIGSPASPCDAQMNAPDLPLTFAINLCRKPRKICAAETVRQIGNNSMADIERTLQICGAQRNYYSNGLVSGE